MIQESTNITFKIYIDLVFLQLHQQNSSRAKKYRHYSSSSDNTSSSSDSENDSDSDPETKYSNRHLRPRTIKTTESKVDEIIATPSKSLRILPPPPLSLNSKSNMEHVILQYNDISPVHIVSILLLFVCVKFKIF